MDSIVLPLVSAIQISQGSFAPTPPGKRHCEPPWGVPVSNGHKPTPTRKSRHITEPWAFLAQPFRAAPGQRALGGPGPLFLKMLCGPNLLKPKGIPLLVLWRYRAASFFSSSAMLMGPNSDPKWSRHFVPINRLLGLQRQGIGIGSLRLPQLAFWNQPRAHGFGSFRTFAVFNANLGTAHQTCQKWWFAYDVATDQGRDLGFCLCTIISCCFYPSDLFLSVFESLKLPLTMYIPENYAGTSKMLIMYDHFPIGNAILGFRIRFLRTSSPCLWWRFFGLRARHFL